MDDMYTRHLDSTWDYTTLGIRTHRQPSTVRPFINDIVPIKIANGDIAIRSSIKHFERSKVIFVDGSEVENVDCVIFATGYTVKFPFLGKEIIQGK